MYDLIYGLWWLYDIQHTHNVIWFTYTTYSYMCNILIWTMYIHACGCTLSKDPAWILLWRRKSLDCHFTEKATREKILTWHAQFPLHSICAQNLWIIWWSRQVSDFGDLRKVSDFGVISGCKLIIHCICIKYTYAQYVIEGSLEVKLPTIWTDEKQSREEAERRERLEERRVEEKE